MLGSFLICNTRGCLDFMTYEKILIEKLAEKEEERVNYWNYFDPFIEIRLKWRASLMRQSFHILPGQKILEIGAGNGIFSRALASITRNECEITASIFSEKYEDSIRNNLKCFNVNIFVLDSFPGKLLNKRFDYIVFSHLLERNTCNYFLQAVKNLLNIGGGLIFFEPNPWNPYFQFRNTFKWILPFLSKRKLEAVSLNRIGFFSILSEIGYTQIDVKPYDFLYPPLPHFLIYWVRNISLLLENTIFLKNLASSLYVVARNPTSEKVINNEISVVDLCEHETLFGKISVVIPCHNEEMNIIPLVNNLKRFFGKYIYEIIIVDDNSDDNTAQIAEGIAGIDSCVHVIKRQPPNGVGRALRDGLSAAKGEYILMIDSDFHNIIPEIRDLFDAVAEGIEMAIGSRFSRESVLINYPPAKIVVNRTFHILANLLLRKHFRDISNNMKLCSKEIVGKLKIESDGFAANVETGLKPILLGYKIKEVPISWVNRSINMGQSSFKIRKVGLDYLRILLKLVWRNLFKKRL